MNFSVIIVSAGESSRMNGIDKQFVLIDNIPVIVRSCMAFDSISAVSEIIIVTNSKNHKKTSELLGKYDFNKHIIITEGAQTRQESVFNGIKEISDNNDFIAVHDGARPLVKINEIEECFKNAVTYGASALCTPVKDTIKVTKDGFISFTPSRNTLFSAQTPQVFEKKIYFRAMKNALEHGLDFTDDCQLIEAVGHRIFVTNGSYSNIKITTPEDIAVAENYLKEGQI